MSTYGHYDLKYIRTDRNGTKIYHDVNCPRCCGYGSLEQWAATGRICFACGGSGLRAKPKTVKIYTPEYAEKLEASRLERERKRLEENPPPSDEELKERADFARRNVWETPTAAVSLEAEPREAPAPTTEATPEPEEPVSRYAAVELTEEDAYILALRYGVLWGSYDGGE